VYYSENWNFEVTVRLLTHIVSPFVQKVSVVELIFFSLSTSIHKLQVHRGFHEGLKIEKKLSAQICSLTCLTGRQEVRDLRMRICTDVKSIKT